MSAMKSYDLVIVGAGFAGLACARRAAALGLATLIIERQPEPGASIHTTGLLVQEVVERLAPPCGLLRRIEGVRLYAPSLRHIDLAASGYGFHATDTAGLMRWMAAEAERAGAELRWSSPYRDAHRDKSGWVQLRDHGCQTRWLIGADGPRSKVARTFGLDVNSEFLLGLEAECCGVTMDVDRLHCFLDADLAPGYLGWLFRGVNGVVQLGLATRLPHQPDLDLLVQKLERHFDFRLAVRLSRRGGLIPAGGPLKRWHAPGVMLVGDAAGLVSPLTAGGIHTALESGEQAAVAVAACIAGKLKDLVASLQAQRQRFRIKGGLRRLFEVTSSNALLERAMFSSVMRAAARHVYFHRAQPLRPESDLVLVQRGPVR